MKRIITRKIRHARVRAKVMGTKERPRFSVFRSNKHLSVQLIDDMEGKTLVAVSDMEGSKSKTKTKAKKESMMARAAKVGEEAAKLAKTKKITLVVFDRGGYTYHGLIKAVAEGARKGGLTF